MSFKLTVNRTRSGRITSSLNSFLKHNVNFQSEFTGYKVSSKVFLQSSPIGHDSFNNGFKGNKRLV